MTWFDTVMKEDKGCETARHKFHQLLILSQPKATDDIKDGIMLVYNIVEKIPCWNLKEVLKSMVEKNFMDMGPLIQAILDEWEGNE